VSLKADDFELKSDVEYGKGASETLKLDLATPTMGSTPFPCIVVIHGGGWAAGNKSNHTDLIKELAGQGYVAASVGYRLAKEHKFPAQVEDVKCCVRYLRAHAEELKIDPKKIGAIGFSAGAHLSMMLGVMDSADGLEGEGGWPDQSSKVQVVVAYFGPTNLLDEYPPTSKEIVKNFIGGTKEEMSDAYKRASPLTYVNEGDAPMLLFQGTADVLVPYPQAYQMAEAMAKAKIPGRVEIMVGENHGWRGAELERTVHGSLDFFDAHLKTPAR
jgi:acetyl esterase/lipase